MNIITRFAPSPTGYLHVGGVRTALFNYLFAKNYDGKFLLRIEDTDDKRLMESSLISIIEGLKWLGLHHDGEIIIQSENLKRHQDVAKQLIDEGEAYYCYCTEEELNAERKAYGEFGYKYSGKCKHRKDTPQNIKPVVRLNSEPYDKIEFDDLITGPVTYHRDNLDDFILLRSDGIPTYMFAVVIDDNDAGVTHVIRGNDHHTNTAKQLMVYKAMKWKEPEYAHIPLIYSEDGTKMSKRKHAVDLLDYRKNGFLPDALLNYLMTLGWTPSKEIISLEEAVKEFGLGKLSKSPARFDIHKLHHINSQYLQARDRNDLMVEIKENFALNHHNKVLPEYFLHSINQSLSEITKRAHTVKEIIDKSYFYLDHWREHVENKNDMESFIKDAKNKNNDIVNNIYSELSKISDWSKQNIEESINNIAKQYNNIKKSDVMKLMRMILTGTLDSYSISFIIDILGKEKTLERIKRYA